MRHLWILLLPVALQFGYDFGSGGDELNVGLIGILEEIAKLFVFVWNSLVIVATYLLDSLQSVYDWFKGLMHRIREMAQWIWDVIVKQALTKLLKLIQTIRSWLAKVFGPLVNLLKNLRKLMDDYFTKYVKPMLVMIQRIRQFLQLFRLLGFKWATRLDLYLGYVEQKIVTVYETLRQQINQVLSFAQLILDPTFLLRRNPLFGALIRSSSELVNLALRGVEHARSPGEDAQTTSQIVALLPASSGTNLTYFQGGTLPPVLAAEHQDILAEFGRSLLPTHGP